MDIIFLALSLVLLVVLVFRGVPIFFSAIIASLFCLITAQLFTGGGSFIDGMVSTAALSDSTAAPSYITGLASYFGNYFWMFILGALFGKLYEISGAAESVANGIVNKLGEKAIIPAIILSGFLLTYGGVSVFVCFFALYPLMLSMFQRADISRTLIPAFYFAGAGTASGWMPGSPQLQNTIPADALGVSYSVAFWPGMIAGIFEMVLVFVWIFYCVRRAKMKGLHFEASASDREAIAKMEGKKRPGFLISLIPMIVLLVVLNATSLGAPVSLAVGVLTALACFSSVIIWNEIWDTLRTGLMGGVNSLFNTAAVVGFGAVVQSTPAFDNIVHSLTSISGNSLIISVIAVAVMSGVCGSGTGGEGIAMPIIKEHFIGGMTALQVEGLARCTGLAALTLDSLPHNGLVVTVVDYSANTHKNSYLQAGVVNVVIPIITMLVLIGLCFMFGYA